VKNQYGIKYYLLDLNVTSITVLGARSCDIGYNL